jgi:hypothetical protein
MNLDIAAEAIWRAHRSPRNHVTWSDVAPLAQERYRRMARAAADALNVPDPAWSQP